jgi:glycosyltransferase involved in cell wall biosynthesis
MFETLVSCLCPTANRRQFIPRMLRCFKQQDYSNLELVIVDDGGESVADLVPSDDPRIRYVYELPRKNHGEKMNRCMELATGEVCIVWDDDDWYAPDRVSRQVAPFADPNVLVTGTSRLYYYVHGTENAYRYQNWTVLPWLGAFALRRSVWEKQPFQNIPAGADCQMLRTIPQEHWSDLNTLDLMVATIHPENASKKNLPSMSFIEAPWDDIRGVTKGSLIESV